MSVFNFPDQNRVSWGLTIDFHISTYYRRNHFR